VDEPGPELRLRDDGREHEVEVELGRNASPRGSGHHDVEESIGAFHDEYERPTARGVEDEADDAS